MTERESDEVLRNDIAVALSRVAYFHNLAAQGPGVCPVCHGPTPGSGMCSTCLTTQANLQGATCDNTFFLAYADGWHPDAWSQSAHTMRQYKAVHAPQQCIDDVHMLTFTATWVHDPCIRAAEQHQEWDVATYVPSKRTGLHPVTGVALNIARIAAQDTDDDTPSRIKRVSIACGPVHAPRVANVDRFTVPDAVRPAIEGKRVLIVDDTWTSGTSIQSAAAALKAAGAASVTGLCVARWLSWRWEPDVPLLQNVTTAPYDPFHCFAGTDQCRLRPNL